MRRSLIVAKHPATWAALVVAAVGAMVWTIAVRRPPSPVSRTGVILDLDGAKTRGNRFAKLVVVEFSNFRCTYCAQFAKQVQPTLVREYVDTGRVLWAFRHVVSRNSDMRLPAAAAECAADQEAFWPMHDALFKAPSNVSRPELIGHAERLGLDSHEFQQCLGSLEPEKRLNRDGQIASRLGIAGTPTFVFGVRSASGTVTIERVVAGAMSGAVFQAIASFLLGEAQ
jgi:protein-disulfide isomerase